jgi:hypothetical protein
MTKTMEVAIMGGIGVPELIILFILFLPAILGGFLAKSKGRNVVVWFMLSGLFWLPIIILLFLPPAREVEGKYRECPKCKEIIKWQALVCKHCNNTVKNFQE